MDGPRDFAEVAQLNTKLSPRVFISYAWEDDSFRHWVLRLAETLKRDKVDARLDQWDHVPTRPFPSFMNSEVRNADFVLVVGSPEYRRKVHLNEDGFSTSGVSWESDLVTNQVFQGHRDKVLAAIGRGSRIESLPDYLTTLRVFDLSDPERRDDYDELLSFLKRDKATADPQPAEQGFVRRTNPLWEDDRSLGYVISFRSFVNSRWPEMARDAIFPSWSDFTAQRIHLPKHVVASTSAHLSRHRKCMLVGAIGSGKSVTAAAIAYEWTRVAGHSCHWLDVADLPASAEDSARVEIADVMLRRAGSLLVLDNAHAFPRLARWVVTEFQRAESSQNRLVVLARPVGALSGTTEATFGDLLSDFSVVLETSPELFRLATDRIRLRRGLEVAPWTSSDYAGWYEEFGGDVIAFAQASLNQGEARRPSAEAVSPYIRSTYLDPLRRIEHGLTVLSRMAAATLIDLEVDDVALGRDGARIAALLFDDGLVQSLERFGHRCWSFHHSGLARLVVVELARANLTSVKDFCANALAEVANDNPRFLGLILYRLDQQEYFDESTRSVLLSRFATDGSARRFQQAEPVGALKLRTRYPELIAWSEFATNPSFRRGIFAALSRAPLSDAAYFLKSIPACSRAERGAWAEEFLKVDGVVLGMLSRPPADQVALLVFVDELAPSVCARLLTQLLISHSFFVASCRDAPNHVGRFVRFAMERLPDKTMTFLRSVLASRDFQNRAAFARPDLLAIFLELANKHARQDTASFANTVLRSEECFQTLITTTPDLLPKFFSVVSALEPRTEMALLDRLLHEPRFVETILSASADVAGRFFAFATRRAAKATAELVGFLLESDGLARCAGRSPILISEALLKIAGKIDRPRTTSELQRLVGDVALRDVLVSGRPEHITYAIRAVRAFDHRLSEVLAATLLDSPALYECLRAGTPEGATALLRDLFALSASPTQSLAKSLLADLGFVQSVTRHPPVHVASLTWFGASISKEATAVFIQRWWEIFRSESGVNEAASVVSSAPMLRAAIELAPTVAEQMIRWMGSITDELLPTLSVIPKEMRQGLLNALSDFGGERTARLRNALSDLCRTENSSHPGYRRVSRGSTC